MKLMAKYLPEQRTYNEEGLFDPLKKVFNAVKDKFNVDLDFEQDPAKLEKDLAKTYLNDEWLDRRKWASPNTAIVTHHGTFIKVPATKAQVMEHISEAFEETRDFVKFFRSEFHYELEFFKWAKSYGWQKQLRAVNIFARTLSPAYGEQNIPKFNGKHKYVKSETVMVSPVLDRQAFKDQTLEIFNLTKVLQPAGKNLTSDEFVDTVLFYWNQNTYNNLKDSIREDFTEEIEKFDQVTNTRIIERRLVHEEEYFKLIDCFRRFDEFVKVVREQTSGLQLRKALYWQLRNSFKG